MNTALTPGTPAPASAQPSGRTTRQCRRLAGAGIVGTACLLLAGAAHAGRPLATDDAATAGARNCQVETWGERGPGQHHLHLAPACGVGEALEINGEWVRRREDGAAQNDLALGAKWVDPAWRLGPLALGLKAWVSQHRLPDGHHVVGERGAAVLLSSELGASGAAHLNLGSLRDAVDGQRHGLLNLALTWKPAEHWSTFVELNTLRHHPATRGAGLRWWLRPDVLGVDLTAARSSAAGSTTVWSFGLGWYGIGY
ncbi:MAG: hypothetical protein RLZZ584_480 [Pseudomonadota bacterium]